MMNQEFSAFINNAYAYEFTSEELERIEHFVIALRDFAGRRHVVASQMAPLDVLRERFEYDAEGGRLVHKWRPGREARAGKLAGSLAYNGYMSIDFCHDGKRWRTMAHRVVYALCTGELVPIDMVIDHIDKDRCNNRFENLRMITQTSNAMRLMPNQKAALWREAKNRRTARALRKSGFEGADISAALS